MKIYTRTGDDGSTGLFGGGRLLKSNARIAAYGTVDETNAVIGMARSALRAMPPHDAADETDGELDRLQHELFVLGGDLASPGEQKYPVPRVQAAHVRRLEEAIDRFQAELPELKHFILPGGTPVGSALHHARTVCRRAERLCVDLAQSEGVQPVIIQYLNRLSDLLFVLARWVNHQASAPEQEWRPVSR